MNGDYKRIQDTVHGCIYIPIEYFDIIDSVEFQRLKHIEQTSIHALFPCAKHDRFIHSVGTYHMGKTIFQSLTKNSRLELPLTDAEWTKIGVTYELACLLHDCGHAPFSHLFEDYYGKKHSLKHSLETALKDDETFKTDSTGLSPKSHEIISAYLLKKHFTNDLQKLGADSNLAARMIVGCEYKTPNNDFEKISNCFISLLNGHIIDADRLDYIKRDKLFSGYISNDINVLRLLEAMQIKKIEDRYVICYKTYSINEIQHVLDVKDFQYTHVINHHKIVYDQHLLKKAVDEFVDKNCTNRQNLFDIDSFSKPIRVSKHTIYLPTDSDIIHLLKENLLENEFAKEWFSRKHNLKPLWKTYTEFCHNFKDLKEKDVSVILKVTDEILKEYGVKYFISDELEPKVTQISPDKIFIEINQKIVSFTDVNLMTKNISNFSSFFYVYVETSILRDVSKIVEEIVAKVKTI